MAGNSEGGVGMDPMHQFEVHPIIELPALAGIDTSFTNSSLWMVLAVGLSVGCRFRLCGRGLTVLPAYQACACVG